MKQEFSEKPGEKGWPSWKPETRLKITRATIALDVISGKPTVVTIPMETILTVLTGSDESARLVDVLWEGRAVQMFAIDLAMRGVEVRTQAAAT